MDPAEHLVRSPTLFTRSKRGVTTSMCPRHGVQHYKGLCITGDREKSFGLVLMP